MGTDSLQQAVNETLKPIIDPLKMLANTPTPPPPILDISNDTTMAYRTPRKFSRNTFHSAIGEDASFNGAVTSSPKPGSPNPVENYLDLLRKDKLENLDTKLGFRIMTDGTLKIGNQPIKINKYELTEGDIKYPVTHGLLQLIFEKEPNRQLILQDDAHLMR